MLLFFRGFPFFRLCRPPMIGPPCSASFLLPFGLILPTAFVAAACVCVYARQCSGRQKQPSLLDKCRKNKPAFLPLPLFFPSLMRACVLRCPASKREPTGGQSRSRRNSPDKTDPGGGGGKTRDLGIAEGEGEGRDFAV